jgi:sec-independent protein translocase protein TatB
VFNLQGSEIVVILLLALVVLGPEKLPDAVRKFTQTYSELKKMGAGFQSELKSALDEPMREMRETARVVRDAADPSKLMAESEAEQRVLDDADRAAPMAAPTADDDWASPPAGPSAGNGWAAPTAGTADRSPFALPGEHPAPLDDESAQLDGPADATDDPAEQLDDVSQRVDGRP